MCEGPLALLLEYLDASLQPTFVLHLTDPDSNSKEDNQEVVLQHTNPALRRLKPVHTELVGWSQTTAAFTNAFSYPTQSGRILRTGPFASPVLCGGAKWAVTIIADRWLVAVSAEQQEGSITSGTAPEGRASQVQKPTKDVPQRPPLGEVSPYGHLGDLGHLKWMRQYDWASSPCGPIEFWPAELRYACEFALATSDPTSVIWGDECTLLYNQAYAVVIGEKHPRAMGRPFKENFEQWRVYYNVFDAIKQTGQSVQHGKLQRMLVRDGFPEEVFLNLDMAPILAADGSVAGICTHIHEITHQVVSERRTQVLTKINKAMATAHGLHELCAAAIGVLDGAKSDVHFAAIYSADLRNDTLKLTLEATAGLSDGDRGTLPRGHSDVPQSGLERLLLEACSKQEPKTLSTSDNSLVQTTLDELKEFGLRIPCREIVIHPLKCFIEDTVAAVMITGTSPPRKFDEDYRSFLHLLTRQIENGINVVKGIEKENELHKAQVTSKVEERFWRFAQRAPVGMYMYNTDDVLTLWNAAFEDIIGRSGDELVGPMAWLDAIHPDCIADISSIWEKYTDSKYEEAVTFDIQFKKPWKSQRDGIEGSLDRTWALGTVYPELSEDGQLTATLGCITDISSIKWAEKMQAEQLSEALEQRRQQENFLDVTSHEMRNPLNAIFHCASELTENIKFRIDSSDASRAQIETLNECLGLATTITYCANHQKRIVDDVLTLSKLDARLLQVYPESTNPIRLYKGILELFTPEIRASGMNTNFRVGESYNRLELKRVMIDPHRVTQIVINLLSNAIKFTKKGKRRDLEMTLDAHLEEPANKPMGTRYVPSGAQHHDPTNPSEWGQGEALYLSFSVKDSGLGMTPEEASSLFQKFSQASPRTHAQFGGSGLGLYISRNLAELHGGRIGLSSQAGFGSTFEFYVRVRRDQTAELAVTPVDRPPPILDLQHMHMTSPALQHVVPENQASEPPPPPSSSSSPASKPTILIVEDNLINQRLLGKLIAKNGYATLTANNGEEALSALSTSTWNPAYTQTHSNAQRLDLVLCDIEMPIMDGKTCVRRVRQLQREGNLGTGIPMVAITGNARAEQVLEMKRCGFDDVVTKPYQVGRLLGVVGRYVGRDGEGVGG
ncbi:hypothetical protein M3J09_006565 [Ascochyta lentis]